MYCEICTTKCDLGDCVWERVINKGSGASIKKLDPWVKQSPMIAKASSFS